MFARPASDPRADARRRGRSCHCRANLFPARSLSFFGKDTKLIYRHYATLYFVVAVDGAESELGCVVTRRAGRRAAARARALEYAAAVGRTSARALCPRRARHIPPSLRRRRRRPARPPARSMLDLIQVFVEVLDKCFENVCELDLIFHPDKVNYILDEIIMGGMVLDTNIADVLEVRADTRARERERGRGEGRGGEGREARARTPRNERASVPHHLTPLSPLSSSSLPQAITDMDKLEKTTKGAGIRA